MTYARFHLGFTVPWVVWSLIMNWNSWAELGTIRAALLTLVIVYAFTSPWDNWAVKRGIWGFPEGRFSFRIAHLPVEEYAFFGLQTLMVIGLMLALQPHLPVAAPEWRRWPAWTPPIVLGAWALSGWRLWRWPGRQKQFAYAFHLLFWTLPVIALQWCIAADLLAARWPLITVATTIIGAYLSCADVLAVRWNLWFFDEGQISGGRVLGLPWEEIAFFFITSLLVAQSFVMFTPTGH
jgi:lycopene cyclase domain-containing protein